MDQPRDQPWEAAGLRPARIAAIVNGLVVLILPFVMTAIAEWTASGDGSRVTARVSSDFEYVTRMLVSLGMVVFWSAPFALIAAWRTWVHARRRLEGGGSGWLGVAEGVALGFCAAVVILLPSIVTRPSEALPYVATYGGMAAVLGLVVSIVLRFTALIALRIAGNRGPQRHLSPTIG